MQRTELHRKTMLFYFITEGDK